MINARMETVAEKPAYRRAVRTSRCLLPADAWYEWQVGEQRPGARTSCSAPTVARSGWPGSGRDGTRRTAGRRSPAPRSDRPGAAES